MKANKKWILGVSALAMAFGVGATTSFTGVSASADSVTAVYSGTEQTSATISLLKIQEFNGLTDFTDWFALGHANKDLSINSYVTHNATNNSVRLSNTTGGGLDFRFHPDAVIDENPYCGMTQLGNFEIKMTIRGVNVGANENIYFGSRNTWDSSSAEYFPTKIAVTGNENGSYNLGSWGEIGEYLTTTEAYYELPTDTITFTVGYVNNHAYYYYGDAQLYGYTMLKMNGITANANTARDGNQTFSLFLTAGTELEILGFTYKRLGTAFDISAADATSKAFIENHIANPAPDPEPENPGTGGSEEPENPGTGGSEEPENPGTGGGNEPENPGTGGSGEPENPGTGGSGEPENPGTGGSEEPENPGTGGGNESENPGTGGNNGGNTGGDNTDDEAYGPGNTLPNYPLYGNNTGAGTGGSTSNGGSTNNGGGYVEEEDEGGCFGTVGGLATVGVALAACVVFKKRRK